MYSTCIVESSGPTNLPRSPSKSLSFTRIAQIQEWLVPAQRSRIHASSTAIAPHAPKEMNKETSKVPGAKNFSLPWSALGTGHWAGIQAGTAPGPAWGGWVVPPRPEWPAGGVPFMPVLRLSVVRWWSTKTRSPHVARRRQL